jgi:hypothetical protein
MRGFFEPDPLDKNTMSGDDAIENAAQAPGSHQATYYDWTTFRMPEKALQRLYYMKPSGSDPRLIIQSVFTLLCVHPPTSNLTTTLTSATVGDVYLRWRCYLVQPQLDLSLAPGIGIMSASAAAAVAQNASHNASSSNGGGPNWLSNYDSSVANVVTNTMVGDSDILAPEIATLFATGGNTDAFTYDDADRGVLGFQSIFNLNLTGAAATDALYSQGLVLQPGCYSLYVTLNAQGSTTREDKHVNGFLNKEYGAGYANMPFAVYALADNRWVQLPYMPGPSDSQPNGAVTMVHSSISEADTSEAEGSATYYCPSVTQGICWECPNVPCLVVTGSDVALETHVRDTSAAHYYNGWPGYFTHGSTSSSASFYGKTNMPTMSWMLSKFALANLDGNLWSHDLDSSAWQYVAKLSAIAAHGFSCDGIPRGTLASTARRAFLLNIPAPAALGQFLASKLPYKSELLLRAPELKDGDRVSEEEDARLDQRSAGRGHDILRTTQSALGDAQGNQSQSADRKAGNWRDGHQALRVSSLEGLSDGKERGLGQQHPSGLQHDRQQDRKRAGSGDSKQATDPDSQDGRGAGRDERRAAGPQSRQGTAQDSARSERKQGTERKEGTTNATEDADLESPVIIDEYRPNPAAAASQTPKLGNRAEIAQKR